jgi:uncharacterized protein YgiM (DUF1202 family)
MTLDINKIQTLQCQMLQQVITTPPTQIQVVTTKSGTRLRDSASTTANILKTYEAGVTLKVIDDTKKSDGTWYKVAKGPSVVGWVRSDVVSAISMMNG